MDGVSVCVLGAGVVGLTTALSLQKNFSNVTILADKFTTETTSDGAAGLFCPFSSFQAATNQITRDIVKDSYKYYEDLRKTFGEAETGILETSGYILSNIHLEEVQAKLRGLQGTKGIPGVILKAITYPAIEEIRDLYLSTIFSLQNPLIENVVPDYRILSREELKACPGEWQFGSYFKSFLIQGRIFLPWALRKFQNNNGKIIQKKLISFDDLVPYNFDVVVNCTGLGAKQLCGDKKLIPLRGQVIKVSAPWVKNFYLLDNDVYIIPGIETTLGGSRQYGNYDLNIDKHISAQIWENCNRILPSLKESAVIREWAGLRPYRVPIRLEAEVRETKGGLLKIVHNYGHGAQGLTTAPGSAKIAVDLVLQILKEKSKL